MKKDDLPRSQPFAPANDNHIPSSRIDAALTRIAEAIGRHIAREHIRVRDAANDNEAPSKKPTAPEP